MCVWGGVLPAAHSTTSPLPPARRPGEEEEEDGSSSGRAGQHPPKTHTKYPKVSKNHNAMAHTYEH